MANKKAAYCSSQACVRRADNARMVLKDVSADTETCPQCGYYLFWTLYNSDKGLPQYTYCDPRGRKAAVRETLTQ